MSRPHERFPLAALLLVVVACAAPWPFASVEPFWWSLVCGAVLTAGALTALAPAASVVRLPAAGRLALVAPPLVAALSLVPLPPALLRAVSPGAVAALERAGVDLDVALRPASLFPAGSVDALVVVGACCVVAWAVVDASAGARGRSLLSRAFLTGGAALAVFGLVQRLVDPDPQRMFWTIEIYEVGTPFGPYVNRNHFGGAMLLFTGVAAGRALAARRGPRHTGRGDEPPRRAATGGSGGSFVPGAVALLCALALLATTSRGAVLGLVVLAAVLLLAMPPRGRLRLGVVLAAASVVLLGGLAAAGLFDDLAGRIFTLYGRWENRFLVQEDALRVAAGVPVLGTSARTFPWVYHAFQTVDGQRYFADAHSDWVQIAMETGATGLLASLVVLATLAGAFLRARRTGVRERWHVLGPLAGCAGLVAHGFFETNLHIPANALLAAVTAGLGYGASLGLRRGQTETETR